MGVCVEWSMVWFSRCCGSLLSWGLGIGVFRGDVRSVDFLGCGEAGSSGLIRFDKCDTRFTPDKPMQENCLISPNARQ